MLRVPQIRFKGFSQDWANMRLGEIFQYERPDPYIVKSDKYSDSNKTPVLTANKAFILGFTNENNTYNSPCIIFDDFTLDNKYVDFPFMVKSSAMKILTIKDVSRYNLLFVYELLNMTKIEIMGHARHYISVVQPTNVSLPQSEEQEKIGNFFQKIDELIELKQKAYDKLLTLKKAFLSKMFPQHGANVPQIRFKGFSQEWANMRLGDVDTISFHKGSGLSKSDITVNGKFKCIHYGELFTKYKAKINKIYSLTNLANGVFLSKSNDVLMPTSDVTPNGLATASCILEKNVILGGDILIIRISPNIVYGIFLAHIIKNSKYKILKLISGTTVFHIYAKNMENFVLSLPQSEEQEKIGNFFQKIDALIDLRKTELTKLKNIKKACLNKMFV